MPLLVEGLRLLNQADPCVSVRMQETGEHVLMASGELHLERCLQELRDRFAPNVALCVSPPLVSFRESLTEEVARVIPEQQQLPQQSPQHQLPQQSQHQDRTKRERLTVEVETGGVRVRVRAVALPEAIREYLEAPKAQSQIRTLFVDRAVELSGSSGEGREEGEWLEFRDRLLKLCDEAKGKLNWREEFQKYVLHPCVSRVTSQC